MYSSNITINPGAANMKDKVLPFDPEGASGLSFRCLDEVPEPELELAEGEEPPFHRKYQEIHVPHVTDEPAMT